MVCSASSELSEVRVATGTSRLGSLMGKIFSNLNNPVTPGAFGALGEEFVPCSLLGAVEKQSLAVPQCHLCHCLGGQEVPRAGLAQEQPQEGQHSPWSSAQLGLSLWQPQEFWLCVSPATPRKGSRPRSESWGFLEGIQSA